MQKRWFGPAVGLVLGVASVVAQAAPVISWTGTEGATTIGEAAKTCRNGDVSCADAKRDNAFFSGWYLQGGYLSLAGLLPGEQAEVVAEYWGKEAGFLNRFLWGGSTVFSTSTAVGTEGLVLLGTAAPVLLGANGVLDFAFRINVGGTGPSGNLLLPNGATNVRDAQPSVGFFFGAAPPLGASAAGLATAGSAVWLLLDDGCGYVGPGRRGCDDDRDDMVVRLTMSSGPAEIPEPGAIALLSAGLLMLGGMVVRRRNLKV
jgi:hypothetical protein